MNIYLYFVKEETKMKKLFIMRGPSLCGKTTLIEELGLKENTISPDDIRKMYFGMEIYQDTTKIIKKDSYKIFSKLYEIIEQRMEYGLLTIIDHSNLLEVNIEKYKNLCYKYGYECIVVNFKTPLNELLERNSKLAYPLDEEEIKKEYEFRININNIKSSYFLSSIGISIITYTLKSITYSSV